MVKRKSDFEDKIDTGVTKKRRILAPRRKSIKAKTKATLMTKKQELKKQYKIVQKDLANVDRDLKSLGYTIRRRGN